MSYPVVTAKLSDLIEAWKALRFLRSINSYPHILARPLRLTDRDLDPILEMSRNVRSALRSYFESRTESSSPIIHDGKIFRYNPAWADFEFAPIADPIESSSVTVEVEVGPFAT